MTQLEVKVRRCCGFVIGWVEVEVIPPVLCTMIYVQRVGCVHEKSLF